MRLRVSFRAVENKSLSSILLTFSYHRQAHTQGQYLPDLPQGKHLLIWPHSDSPTHLVASCHYPYLRKGVKVNSMLSLGIHTQFTSRWYSTEPNETRYSHSKDSLSPTSKGSNASEFKLVYTAPLKGWLAVALLIGTAGGGTTAAILFPPLLLFSGQILSSALVLLAGVSIYTLVYSMVRGYVIQLLINEQTKTVQLWTFSMCGRRKYSKFAIAEAGPPRDTADLLSTFQAKGKSYFVHTELSRIRNFYLILELTFKLESFVSKL